MRSLSDSLSQAVTILGRSSADGHINSGLPALSAKHRIFVPYLETLMNTAWQEEGGW